MSISPGPVPEHDWQAEPRVFDATGASDSQLLRDFVERRSQAAFAELVRIYGPMVYGVCRRVVGHHYDAEDAFQATFLVLSQKAAAIKNGAILFGWLYRVAYHVSLRAKSEMIKRTTKEKAMSDDYEPAAAAPSVWVELEPILDAELNHLSEKYRLPVLLCDLGGRTQKEAATELGWSQGTLSTRLTKARSILADRLTRHGFTLSAGALAVLISQQAASAAVPATLMATTLQTAGVLSASQTASIGVASSKVMALAQGTVKSMFLINLKIAAAAVVVLAATAAGVQLQREKEEEKTVAEVKIQNIQPGAELTEIPPEVIQALEENAAQLNPISISYTVQLQSLMSEEETRARLKLGKNDPAFRPWFYRKIWQDEKYYHLREPNVRVDVTKDDKRRPFSVQDSQFDERSFDGQIIYYGCVMGPKHEGMLFKSRDSLIERINRYNRNANFGFSHPYFDAIGGFTGLYFHEEIGQDVDVQARSIVLNFLNSKYHLISVANVTVDDRSLLKIEFQGENGYKTWADNEDIEKLKRDAAFLNSPPEMQKGRLENILNARKLPATKRWVFYLDPALHYAVRQKEEWYDPQTLIHRVRCSDFEQLSNRQVWLPRKCEVDERTFNYGPEVLFTAPALLRVVLVSELSGERVPDESFVINYTEPGVKIVDETAAVREEYVTGKTPAETEKNRETAQKRALDPAQNGLATQPPSHSAGYWFLLANGAVLLLFGGFLAYQRFVTR